MVCVRFTLIATTLLIWIGGSVSVGFASYTMVQDMKFKGLTGYQVLDGIILGVACFVFITGFLGCLGAALRKRNVLKIFFILLAIFLLIQITLVVLYFVQRNQLEAVMKDNWNKMSDDGKKMIQNELNCCGMNKLDSSCSQKGSNTTQTCFEAIEAWFSANLIIVGGCGGGLILIELLALTLTCLLIREIGRDTTVVPINSGSGRDWQSRGKAPQIIAAGMPMRPRPVQPVYNGGDDMYIDDYEDPPIEHSRKEWARQSYRQEWRMDRKKR